MEFVPSPYYLLMKLARIISNPSSIVAISGIATCCTVLWCVTRDDALTCHHERLFVGHSKHIRDQNKRECHKRNAKTKADQTKRGLSRAGVAANGRDALYVVRPYYEFCDIVGYKKCRHLKVLKCGAWGGE